MANDSFLKNYLAREEGHREADSAAPENIWYYTMLEAAADYSLHVDNYEASNANNDITIFVNCRIKDTEDNTIGIVGVGLRADYLQSLLKEYQKDFGVNAYLVNDEGTIEISSEHTGYETVDLFEGNNLTGIRYGMEQRKSRAAGFLSQTDLPLPRFLPEYVRKYRHRTLSRRRN